MKSLRLPLLIIICAFMLIGCTNEEDSKNGNQNNDSNQIKKEEADDQNNESVDGSVNEPSSEESSLESASFLDDIPPVPENAQELIDQTEGKFAIQSSEWGDEKYKDLAKETSKLKQLPKNATEEELDLYYNYIYSLVAEDFPDPQDTIKKWELGSFGNPDLPDSRYHFKENYNIEVLLDASGSMGAYIGGKTMMQIAKESINNFMKEVPKEANVSFRVYGHKGTGDSSDKEMSCAAIEQVYGYASYDEAKFQKELDKLEPAGWTPLADALKQAQDALKKYDTEQNTNLIYVVSDGVETCDGDPVKVAKSLGESNAKPIINIIGFNVDTDAQKQLKQMADVSGGIFSTVDDQKQLEEEFNRAEETLEAWESWKKDALKDVNSMEIHSQFDILSFNNDWNTKSTRMFNNLRRVPKRLEKEGIINSEQLSALLKRNSDIKKLIKTTSNELKEELKDINTEKLEEMKQSIKEKYDKQTSE